MFVSWILPLGGEADGVADGGDGFPLAGRYRGEQGAGGGKDDPLPAALAHLGEQVSVEHGGGAAAAGGAGVHILLLSVVEEHATVLIALVQFHAVPAEEVPDDGVSQFSQIAGEDGVIVLGRVPVSRKKAERVS